MKIYVDEIPIRALAVRLDMDIEAPGVMERLRAALNSVVPHLRVDDAPRDWSEASMAAHQAYRDGRQDGWTKAITTGDTWQWALGVAAQTAPQIDDVSEDLRHAWILDEARWLVQQMKTPEQAGAVVTGG